MKVHLGGFAICVLIGLVLMFGINTVGWMVGSIVKGVLFGAALFAVWEVARWVRR